MHSPIGHSQTSGVVTSQVWPLTRLGSPIRLFMEPFLLAPGNTPVKTFCGISEAAKFFPWCHIPCLELGLRNTSEQGVGTFSQAPKPTLPRSWLMPPGCWCWSYFVMVSSRKSPQATSWLAWMSLRYFCLCVFLPPLQTKQKPHNKNIIQMRVHLLPFWF